MHAQSPLLHGIMAVAFAFSAAEDPVGVWNLKIRVGKIGEGIRPVLLRVAKEDGRLAAKITGLRSELRDVDGFRFENDLMIVEYGAYRYELKVQGDMLAGSVASPAGMQKVTGMRQRTLLYVGDNPPPLEKTWTGILGDRYQGVEPYGEEDPATLIRSRVKTPEDFVLIARRTIIGFTNAKEHEQTLMKFAGKPVSITGTWRTDKIEIAKIELASARR